MSNDPSSSSSTRRILSRSKQNEEADSHSSSRTKSDSSSRTTTSSHSRSLTNKQSTSTPSAANTTKEVKNVDIKMETTTSTNGAGVTDASFSSVVNAQTQHQQQLAHNLAVNYINKEPFNEDIEVEESSYGQDMKWRKMVIENFRQIIEDIKKLQLEPALNVRFTQLKPIHSHPTNKIGLFFKALNTFIHTSFILKRIK